MARQIGPSVLIVRNAPSRSQSSATQKLLDALRRGRFRHMRNIARGEANALLMAVIARRYA